MRSVVIILISLAFCCFAISIALSQTTEPGIGDNPIHDYVDVHAEYPGGLESFYQFISEKIIYPPSARQKGVQGTLFITFVVDVKGTIEKSSVKVSWGLNEACDREAVRVVLSNTNRWKSAQKNGVAVRQRFTLPVVFKLTDVEAIERVKWVNPIKTVVAMPSDKRSIGWNVYGDDRVTNKIGKVLAGDSVEIIGWAPWQYCISYNMQVGYIHFKSLQVSAEMKHLNDMILKESMSWQQAIDRSDSVSLARRRLAWSKLIANHDIKGRSKKTERTKDSLELINSPNLFFRISSNKAKIFMGECATIRADFYVREKNTQSLQFYDLSAQMEKLLHSHLKSDWCWIASNNVEDIAAAEVRFGRDVYFKYNIYTAAFCPFNGTQLSFPSMDLDMSYQKATNRNEVDKIVSFASRPLVVHVDPLQPVTQLSSADLFKLVGEFDFEESLSKKSFCLNEQVVYSHTVMGKGLTFPLRAALTSNAFFSCKLVDEVRADTIIDDQYYSKATFTHLISFNKPGIFDLSKVASYSFFSPADKRRKVLQSAFQVEVTPCSVGMNEAPAKSLQNAIIALDISQSMLVEDYQPNRLGAAKAALLRFFKNKCDLDFIVFGGSVKKVDFDNDSPCYSEELIHSYEYSKVAKGTAIGDAIWEAIQIAKGTNAKRLVIIGDGDNTTGHLTLAAATELAKSNKLKIFTIGIGTPGKVRFGVDLQGKPQVVENTFSDKDFKAISAATGGGYYWAKDESQITEILNEILLKPSGDD